MDTKKLLQKLISINSVSGNEEEIQKFIFKYIKSYKLKPFYVAKNVAIKIKGKDSSSALIFNSHVDTVCAGNLALWNSGPFSGVVKKGNIYGLGASDEKASVAASLKLIEFFSKQKPDCDLWITYVVNEEVDGLGTKEFIKYFDKYKSEYKDVAGILGEPTGLKKIEIGHKGNVFVKVTVSGDSGHGSQPEKVKKQAIKLIYKLIEKLDEENKVWSKKYKNEFLGIPTISLTSINGGDINSPNKFPDTCTASFDIRTTPEVYQKAFDLIKEVANDVDPKIKIDYLYPPAPYGYTDKEEKIVKITKKITNARLSSSFGSNDMCFFTGVGIPAVVFGPGEPDSIHKLNEWVSLKNIDKCVEIYKEIIQKYSGGGDLYARNRN